MPYGTLVMDDGSEFFFEIETPIKRRYSEREVLKELRENFGRIMQLVKATAQSAHAGYNTIPVECKPAELEITFGIKLNAEAGVIFTKMGSEGSFQVTLRWK